jgi:uncharacterized phage-associated protein
VIAHDVAAAVIADQSPLTPAELYMLVFFIAGEYSALTALPMFPESFEAWGEGPIVPALWKTYERFEGEGITAAVHGDPLALDDLAIGCVASALERYANYSGAALIDLAHSEPAWQEGYASKNRNAPIPTEALIRSFRAKHANHTISDEDLDRLFGKVTLK